MSTTVRQLLNIKRDDVWSIQPGATVFEALELMADKNIGAVLIMDGQKLVGIFSERDYARKVALKGKASRDTRVDELMTGPVVCVTVDRSVEECMVLMTEKRVRHLPVIDDDRVLGIVSIGDVVSAIIVNHERLIQDLEAYVSGKT